MRKYNFHYKYALGFSLNQLLVSIAILSILMMFAVPAYQNYIKRARLEQAKSALLKNVQHIEKFYSQNKKYKKNSTTWADLAINQTDHFCIKFSGNPRGSTNEQRYILKAVPINTNQEKRVLTISENHIIMMCENSTLSCNTKNKFFTGTSGRTEKNCVVVD